MKKYTKNNQQNQQNPLYTKIPPDIWKHRHLYSINRDGYTRFLLLCLSDLFFGLGLILADCFILFIRLVLGCRCLRSFIRRSRSLYLTVRETFRRILAMPDSYPSQLMNLMSLGMIVYP